MDRRPSGADRKNQPAGTGVTTQNQKPTTRMGDLLKLLHQATNRYGKELNTWKAATDAPSAGAPQTADPEQLIVADGARLLRQRDDGSQTWEFFVFGIVDEFALGLLENDVVTSLVGSGILWRIDDPEKTPANQGESILIKVGGQDQWRWSKQDTNPTLLRIVREIYPTVRTGGCTGQPPHCIPR